MVFFDWLLILCPTLTTTQRFSCEAIVIFFTFSFRCTVTCDKWRRLAWVCTSCEYLARQHFFFFFVQAVLVTRQISNLDGIEWFFSSLVAKDDQCMPWFRWLHKSSGYLCAFARSFLSLELSFWCDRAAILRMAASRCIYVLFFSGSPI